jgi:hypothetical protein
MNATKALAELGRMEAHAILLRAIKTVSNSADTHNPSVHRVASLGLAVVNLDYMEYMQKRLDKLENIERVLAGDRPCWADHREDDMYP